MDKILQVEGCVEADIFRVLASTQRRAVLEMLGAGPSSISGIANHLGIDQPSASRHIQQLQKAGLVATAHEPGRKGSQKICRRLHRAIHVTFPHKEPVSTGLHTIETSIPLGSYTKADIFPTCGMASEKRLIGERDNPRVFTLPQHIDAQVLWFCGNYVEYVAPREHPADAVVKMVRIRMEISSEGAQPIGENECPSDISIWINGVKIGPWRSWGFYTGRKGAYTPDWWEITHNQFGLLKEWVVNEKGSFIDMKPVSSCTVEDLRLNDNLEITLRIGIDEKDSNAGGMCLFGEKFGNHPHNILMTIAYERTTGKGEPRDVNADSM